MERLTIRTEKGAAMKMAEAYDLEDSARQDLMKRYRVSVDRLAAYEDTGLEPEEVAALARTKRDGRLVVLPPIKIGDTAFFIINKRIYEGKVYYMRWEHHKSFGVRGDISADAYGGVVGASLFDFGKTVFLTREEAKAALKKKKEENI